MNNPSIDNESVQRSKDEISERKRAEHELARLAAIVESSNDAIIGKDLDGTIQSWNDAAEQMYGYSRDEVVGKPITIIVPPDRHHEIVAILERIRHGERVEPFETVRVRNDGQVIHISLTVSPIKDHTGRAVGASTIARDVTARKQAELALRDREHRLRSVIETAGSAIVCVSSEQQIIEWNAEAERIFGYSRKEALGKNPYELIVVPDQRDNTIKEVEKIYTGQPMRAFELSCLHRDQSQRTILWNASLLLDGQDQPIGHVAVGQDITELKAAQDKLIQSERLAAMGQMMSSIAHESRNALQRIQAGVDMLKLDIPEDSEAAGDLAQIRQARNDLQTLLDSVRDFAAPVVLNLQICNLADVWQQAWRNLDYLEPDRQVELIEQTQNVDLYCTIDSFRIEQVFRNLIENSLAACSDPVKINISCSDSKLNSVPAVSISVRDNGPGLTQEQQDRIFEAFYTTKPKGTGLGMAIALKTIQAHHGTLVAGKGDGGGAEFVITLPRQQK